MKITILGCGAAGGVPTISGGWGQCDPANPKNRRRRQSILVEEGGAALLVDTTPDLREQLLDAGVRRLDGVLYTHTHADHLHGIDDLREINRAMNAPIPTYGSAETLASIRERFGYVFEGVDLAIHRFIFRPWLVPHVVEGPFAAGGIEIVPYEQDHGFGMVTLGFRFGRAAYSTDLRELPEESLKSLEGLDLWVVGCLHDKVHETHANLAKVLEWVERLKPRLTVLVHMSPRFDYAELAGRLPAGVIPGYDGQVLTV